MKYRPEFPTRFDSMDQARKFCRNFFDWYNHEHYHSGLGLITPVQVYHGMVEAVLQARNEVLAAAYERHPERFLRKPPQATKPAEEVWINQPPNGTIEFRRLISTPAV